MGILSYIKAGWDGLVPEKKDYSYQQFEPKYQWQQLSLPALVAAFTNAGSYTDKANVLLSNSVSKACIEMRAIGVSDIVIKADKGNGNVKSVLNSPNSQDGTMQIALRNWETVLSIGGGFYWYWDLTLPSNPKLYSLRPDFVTCKIVGSQRIYQYNPAAALGTGTEPEMIFTNDATGKTISAEQRIAPKQYRSIRAAIQPVFYYDPLTAEGGGGPGDSALRAVDIMNGIDTMINRKVCAGGNKAGFFQITNQPTAAEYETIKLQMRALNVDGQVSVLPPGMQFKEAQLTFQEMSILEIRNQMAKDICTAFRIPAELVDEDQSTYATARAKDKMLYRNFIAPEANWLLGQLQNGLRLYLDPNASLSLDESSIAHLETDNLDAITAMAPTGCFTINEIRARCGLPPHPDGDTLVNKQVPQGQPENKPKGPVDFNADAGNRGDKNNND